MTPVCSPKSNVDRNLNQPGRSLNLQSYQPREALDMANEANWALYRIWLGSCLKMALAVM